MNMNNYVDDSGINFNEFNVLNPFIEQNSIKGQLLLQLKILKIVGE